MIALIAAFAKLPALAKAAMVGFILISGAALTGVPIHDIWFDYVLFIFFSAIVGGMPEPDTEMRGARFFYTWLYRTGHLLVASATAYFMHQKKWQQINGTEER